MLRRNPQPKGTEHLKYTTTVNKMRLFASTQKQCHTTTFELLTTTRIQTVAFWNATPYSLVDGYQCIRRTHCQHILDNKNFYPQNRGGFHVSNYSTTSQNKVILI
jgi:hypothetical protein